MSKDIKLNEKFLDELFVLPEPNANGLVEISLNGLSEDYFHSLTLNHQEFSIHQTRPWIC